MPSPVKVPLSAKPPVVATCNVLPRDWLPPSTFVTASCVGLVAIVSLSVDPDGLALPVVGTALSVSAETVMLLPVTGVAAVLSTKASELVIITTTAIPAPELADDESAVDVTFVFTFEVSETSPLEEVAITLVSESCVLPVARTNAATTEESFCSAFVQLPSSPESLCGAVVLLTISFVAAYLVESKVSVTTSPLK